MKFTLSCLKEHLKTNTSAEMNVCYERMEILGGAMLKYGMPDLRDMFAGDGRWLGHYGFSPLLQANLATGLS